MKTIELTNSQKARLASGQIVKVFSEDNKALSLMNVNDKVAVVKFDNSKPMFTRVILNTSSADTLTLTAQETKELLDLSKAGITNYVVYRSSGYKATKEDIEGIKDKLSLTQYQLDTQYVADNKVASVKAQELLSKARKVVIDTNTLQVISDNNASYQVVEYIEIE